MSTKHQSEQQYAAKAISIKIFKKKRLKIVNNKLSNACISEDEIKSKTWFQNEGANETDLDFKKGSYSDVDHKNLVEQSRTKQAVCPKFYKIEVKWNKGEQNLYSRYRKSSQELQKQGSKTFTL